jgi:hypothetical protein
MERMGLVRDALAAQTHCRVDGIPPRVAASVTHLGLVARLIAPALAASANEQPLDMRAGELWWQNTIGGPVPLSVPDPGKDRASTDNGQAPDTPSAGQHLLDELIYPITAATGRLIAVSPRVLWGNVASAINAAASQVAAQCPALSSPAWAMARAYRSHPRLSRERAASGPGFRRSSCCLIYMLTPGEAQGVCGDCVLNK